LKNSSLLLPSSLIDYRSSFGLADRGRREAGQSPEALFIFGALKAEELFLLDCSTIKVEPPLS
jgi:hypothetical protein